MNDIGQLRADLEVLKRYEPMVYSLAAARAEIENKIARLEAEADPWRDAKMRLVEFKLFTDDVGEFRPVKDYVDHLTAELDAKDKRIAGLEAKNAIWVKALKGFDPDELDPARVLATAVAMMRETGYKGNEMIYAMSHASKDAKPYRLKGGDDVG